MKDNVVYVKTENGIFKCYESETMHKPIYYLVNSNGYIDYTEVIKVLTIDDLFIENQELKKQLNEKIVLEMKLKEELEDKRKEYQETYKDVRIEIKSYKNQQKEFIEYLENERNYIKAHYSQINGNYMRFQPVIETLEKVLEKYKEIIGGDRR